MKMKDLEILKYIWEQGMLSLRKFFNMTTEGTLTEEEFFIITRYNYQGLKKSREWD